jgi:hypothetical protein
VRLGSLGFGSDIVGEVTRGDVAILVDAVLDSKPVRVAKAGAELAVVLGVLGLMAAAIAFDCACGREGEWP